MSITLRQWVTGSEFHRDGWLKAHIKLDPFSQQVLDWTLAFRAVGVPVTDKQMLAVYETQKQWIAQATPEPAQKKIPF